MEVFGADFAGSVTPDRARASIIEACRELLNQNRSKPMEEILKSILAEMEKSNELLTRIARATEGKRQSTLMAVDGAKQREAMENAAAEPKPCPKVEIYPEKTITIEQLREVATKYSAAFGMEDLLALNLKFGGGEKKLSKIAPENYSILHKEMTARLEREDGKKAVEAPKKEEGPTLDDVKAKAKGFLDKNGAAALTAILKVAFKVEKVSALKPEQYPAFIEAISNA
jgi:hypothetical protein